MFFLRKKSTITVGRQGEDIAANWLVHQGYTIVKRNYRKKFGEIDIVARQGEYLVFVEVKTRSSRQFGSPFEAVHWKKQQQLIRIAKDYLLQEGLSDVLCRFDVLSVYLEKNGTPRVEIIENAFELIE